MPVPTFLSAPRGDLADILWRGETAAAKKMFDAIDQLGWVIDENPGAHLIAHNSPINDAPIYIRVDSDEAKIDQVADTSFTGSTTMAVATFYTGLAGAQNETGAIGSPLAIRSADFNGSDVGDKKVDYAWIGDSRTAYLLVAGIDLESAVNPGYPLAKYTWYVFGEGARIAGDPGFSVFGGHGPDNGDTSVTFYDGNDGLIRGGGLTNSAASGSEFTAARLFGAGTLGTDLGEATGSNSSSGTPYLSPLYVREEVDGVLRGILPGLVVPGLGMATPSEGIVEGVPVTTSAGPASGLMVPSHERISRTDGSTYRVFIDLSNDWDLYHAP